MANADETKTIDANNGTGTEEVEVKKEETDAVKVETDAVKVEADAVKVEIDAVKVDTDAVIKEEVKVKQEKIVLTKDLEQKIIRQMEYYFGDINLPKDKFLLEQISLDEGWIPLTVMLTFKRLAAICPCADTIVTAILNSEKELIHVSNDRLKVRRNPEMPVPEYNEERRKELMGRTAYAKGFALDEQLETIMKFMEDYGPFESIHMRTYKDKALKKFMFKGSIFIIFKDVETAKKFIDLPELKYKEKQLIRKWQTEYIEEKKLERSNRESRRPKKDGKEQQKSHTFPKGAILHMTGFTPEVTSRETIKKQVSDVGGSEPAYVTFEKGNTEGFLRFSDENGAVDFVKKVTDSKMKIDDADITVRALEGDEEETFLTSLSETMSKMRNQHKHFGGKGKNRKRKGGHDGGPRSKHNRK